jgi:predicted RNA-binding protein with PIN domain
MPYLIDGHNLIPRIPGLALADVDDEMQLVEMLQEFCRRTRKQAEVYFDNAPPGGSRARTFGPVLARFIRQGYSADDAIKERLKRLGRASRNWTVVSSDQSVQAEARASQAHIQNSEAFARLLVQTLEQSGQENRETSDVTLPPGEVDDWLKLFGVEEE